MKGLFPYLRQTDVLISGVVASVNIRAKMCNSVLSRFPNMDFKTARGFMNVFVYLEKVFASERNCGGR